MWRTCDRGGSRANMVWFLRNQASLKRLRESFAMSTIVQGLDEVITGLPTCLWRSKSILYPSGSCHLRENNRRRNAGRRLWWT